MGGVLDPEGERCGQCGDTRRTAKEDADETQAHGIRQGAQQQRTSFGLQGVHHGSLPTSELLLGLADKSFPRHEDISPTRQ